MKTLAALLFALTVHAADLSGIWVGQVPTRNGESLDIALFQPAADFGFGKNRSGFVTPQRRHPCDRLTLTQKRQYPVRIGMFAEIETPPHRDRIVEDKRLHARPSEIRSFIVIPGGNLRR